MATTYEQPSTRGIDAEPLNRLLARAYTLNWEAIAYIVIFALAVFTRFYNLGDRVMSHDESLHTRYSYNLFHDGSYQHTPLMHGPILFHMTALMYFLFGDNDFTARIYAAVLGILMVMFPLLFRRWIGRTGAVLASVMILISPMMMYYNRYIREDTPSIFFTLVMVYCIMMYLNGPLNLRRRARWLYILSAAMLGSLGSKESAFIYIAIFGSFLTLYFIVRLVQHFGRTPGRPIMYVMSIGFLLGCVTALGMYCVLSIIPPSTLGTGDPGSLATVSFYSWTTIVIASIIVALIGTALWAFRGSRASLRPLDIVIIVLVAIVVCGGMIILEQRSYFEANANETSTTSDPNAESAVALVDPNNLPIVAEWIVAALIIIAVLVSYVQGWWRTLHRFPELDVMIVMGTLILPWLTAVFIAMTHASPTDYSTAGIQRALFAILPLAVISITVGMVWNWKRWLICATIFLSLFAFFFTTMFTNPMGLATGMVGSLGYWIEQQGVRRGNQPQYYYLLVIMPFYEFLPVIGGVLAMLAGLTRFWRYRREQLEQEVSNEPSFLDGSVDIDDPLAERPPREAIEEDVPSLEEVIGPSVPAAQYFASIESQIEARVDAARADRQSHLLRRVPFLLMVSWWALLNLIGYTLAGEKMPWLATHMTIPLILLAGWYFGSVFDNVDWSKFTQRGWVLLLLVPLLFVVLFQVVEPFLVGQSPFAGLQQQQLSALYEWLAMVAVSGIVIMFIYQVVEKTGWRHLRSMVGVATFLFLSVLTFRSAWMASFVNYNLATELLVYAHSAPAVKTVLSDLEELSQRMTGGMDLKFAYDNETSWPNSWYYRSFPNAVFVGGNPTPQSLRDAVAVVVGEANRSKVEPILADRYYHFEYIRMWWPMQDYFNLTPERIANTFDFSPDNVQAAQIRRGLFDIWWSRDYRAYSEATGGNWTLANWPVSDRMHFYVRKDVAAQIWNLGVGEGTAALAQPEEVASSVCIDNWQQRTPDLVFNAGTTLNRPIDLAVGNGLTYVADQNNNRIAVYDMAGNYQSSIGQPDPNTGTSLLNRPNSVAIGPDGNLYVADTWNYRVQVFSPDGQVLRTWGQPGQFGMEAGQSPEDAFWAPRDIAVDQVGQVYVSDTGNKRIRVYTLEGQYIRDIGSGGSSSGQLDEPSGVLVHPDGRVFVADTWNRRISVFAATGAPMYTFPVNGWYADQGNRPYLALDVARNLLYVTDPDAGRVLVYDTAGNCVGSFGQTGEDVPGVANLKIIGGITTDAEGQVYLTDIEGGYVLRYAPFQSAVLPPVGAPQNNGAAGAENTSQVESTQEMSAIGGDQSQSTDEVQASDTTAEASSGADTTATVEAVG